MTTKGGKKKSMWIFGRSQESQKFNKPPGETGWFLECSKTSWVDRKDTSGSASYHCSCIWRDGQELAGGVTCISHGCRGQAALSQSEIAHEWVRECGCMFGGQEPQTRLTCIAGDPVFNYWLEHLGDLSDGHALDEKAIKAMIGKKNSSCDVW